MNGVFLLLGLVMSVLSKILQFKFYCRVSVVYKWVTGLPKV